MSPSVSRHCKLCVARGECDVSDCPVAFLVEGRQPITPKERALAKELAVAMAESEEVPDA